MTGSGKPARAERATAKPATDAAAPAKNCRLELVLFMGSVLSMGCCGRGVTTRATQRYEAVRRSTLQDPLKVGFGDPEIALRANGRYRRLGLVAHLVQKIPDAFEHAVVVKNRFFGDELTGLQNIPWLSSASACADR